MISKTWETFKSFYHNLDGMAWIAWDVQLKHMRGTSGNERVSIEEAAIRYAPSALVKQTLDRLITPEVYAEFISNQVNVPFLESQGFYLVKKGQTRVFSHRDCNWLIKVGTAISRSLPMESVVKCALEPQGNNNKLLRNINLLRAPGRDYFKRKWQEITPEKSRTFHFAKERIYTAPHAEPGALHHQRYFSISRQEKILSPTKTIALLKKGSESEQREVARNRIALIIATRLHDNHPGNIVLREDLNPWCFEIFDPEPIGVLVDEEDEGENLFDPKEHILHGLIIFRDHYCRANGLTYMALEVDQAIVDYIKENPEISVRKAGKFIDPIPANALQKFELGCLIVASVLCPLIPLAFLISALIITNFFPPDPSNPYSKFRRIAEETPGFIVTA